MSLLPTDIETGSHLVVTNDFASCGSGLSVLKGQRVRVMCTPGSAATGAVVARLSDDEWGVVPLANLAVLGDATAADAAVDAGTCVAMRAVHAHADDQVDLLVGERCQLVPKAEGKLDCAWVRRLPDGAEGFVPADALQPVATVEEALNAMSLAALNRVQSVQRAELLSP